MALLIRKRYNLCETTLGAALATGATAITFGTALKEGGPAGTDIPTLASDEYLALRIESEIVYLTAYATGATAGTIERAKEGTLDPGGSHPNGAAVALVPTKLDAPPIIKSVIRKQNAGGGNDYSKTTTAWEPVDGANLKLTFAAAEVAVGDWVGVSVSLSWNAGSAQKCGDIASWVAGAPARYWGSGTVTPPSDGLVALGCNTLVEGHCGVTVWKQIEAADLSAGALEIRLMRAQSNTNPCVLYCRADDPIHFQAMRVRS